MTDPPESYPADVQESFEYCEDCESITVSVDQHTCPSGGRSGRPSAARRAELAAADDRPLEMDVLYPEGRSQNNAWAYHELEDGDPLHEVSHRSGATVGSRQEAIDHGCYPCRQCRLIQERGPDDE